MVGFDIPLVSERPILAIGLNYADHSREFGAADLPTWRPHPCFFTKLAGSKIAHNCELRWNAMMTDQVDWEAELAVVIGRRGRDISTEDALDYVFGYTIVNDITARDIQAKEQQRVRAKSLDTFAPIGPAVILAQIVDATDVLIRARLNGEIMQERSTYDEWFPDRNFPPNTLVVARRLVREDIKVEVEVTAYKDD